MNILIADSRMSIASLLAAELASRDESVTLAASVNSHENGTAPAQEGASTHSIKKIFWNPFSWLSSDSLVFEAASPSGLDAIVLIFDLEELSRFFSGLSYSDIFLSSAAAFQTLAASALKRFESKRFGRIAFILSSRGSRAKPLELKGLQLAAASSAEAAFERFAEETAVIFSHADEIILDTILIKSDFSDEGFVRWAADCITGESTRAAKSPGSWLFRGGGGLGSIFQRRT